MSTNSTASTYIRNIDQAYPVAGQDNDSQGFRDNFKNIQQALTYSDQDIADLQLSSVSLTKDNDFGNHLIKQAQFQDCSLVIFDDTQTVQAGDVVVDYTKGSYQKFVVGSGNHNFTFNNWPNGGNQSGSVILSISTASTVATYLNFNDISLINLGPNTLPVLVSDNKPQIFKVWSENNGVANTVFVKQLNEHVFTAPNADINAEHIIGIDITATNSLTIGPNIFKVGTVINPFATVVTAAGKSANLALLPTRISTSITGAAVDAPTDSVATKFGVASTDGILVGAKFNFLGTPTTYTVTAIDINAKIITTQSFAVGQGLLSTGDAIEFVNPQFGQPSVVTLTSAPVNSLTGTVGDLKGQLHVDGNSLYVSFADYGNNQINWLKLSSDVTLKVTAAITDNSTTLATTAFVHNIMPGGAIILWSGSSASIPAGWTLCNGTNGAPNLIDTFVIAAGGAYSAGSQGGTANAVVVSHTHTASNSINDPGHQHATSWGESSGPGMYGATGTTGHVGSGQTDYNNYDFLTSIVQTGISVSTTVDASGESGVNANLPPYYALCYIMKTTGR